jgi:hypothetical protein
MDARLDANSSAIYGARLSASGQILDPNGILISAFGGTLGARSVDVTWDGENYFVGWSRGSSVNTQRVAPSGTLVGAPVLAGTSSFFSSVEVAVASNGERNYVAYSSAWTTMVAAFETDGALAYSSSGVMLGDETQRPVDIACGSDGSCLVVSEYGSSVQFARFNDAAASSVEGSIPDSGNPRVAHDGDDFVVVSDDWTAGDPPLRASVVTQAGVVEAPVIRSNVYGARGLSCASGQCVALVGNAALGFEPHQGWTWVAGLDTPAGREADSIVTNGTDYLVVGWGYNYETRDEVWAQRVASEGSTSGVRIVSTTTTNSQVQPDVSCGATSCLVVWQDDRVDTLQIRGALTTKTGSPLTGSTLGLGCDAGGCDARHPSVAYAAGRFVTAYECTFAGSYQTVCATSVQDNGTIVYHGAPSVGTDLRRPRLAAGAGGELLAVAQRGVDFGSGDIVGVLVDAAAGPVSEILITEAVDDQLAPAVTFDGTNYVVAWEDWRRGPAFGPDVMAARVNASGTVLDPQGFNVSVRNSAEARPAIASDGAGSVVVTWEDNRGGSWDIYGARVSAGSVTDANGISFGTPGTSQQRRPAMAWNGTSYQVVWEDDRNGNGEIYGRQITTGGAMSGGAFGVVTSTTAATAPELAGDGAGGSLLVYQRYVPALAQTRVRAKAITP